MTAEIHPIAPSGEQFTVRHGDQYAVIVEVGGALRSYTVEDREVFDGYSETERCSGARGHPLIPWPNRLRDGVYSVDGTEHRLPLTEPGKHNAIHGLVRWANWTPSDHRVESVTMSHVLHPHPGWPFTLSLDIHYALSDDGLTVMTAATNLGAGRCPYGAGAHPYLRLGDDGIDGLRLRAPGQTYMPTDDQGIPTGSVSVEGTDRDFLTERVIGDTQLDTGYGELRREQDGRAYVRLSTADETETVSLWMDDAYRYLMLFTGDSLSAPERRRSGLGIEPMTCAPNAFQSGDGLRFLAPGETFISTWGIAPGDAS